MEVPTEFIDCLARQRAAYLKDPVPVPHCRADLEALHRMVTENETEIVSAIDADFGVRSAVETRLLELFPVREGHPKRNCSLGKVDAPTEAGGRLACLFRRRNRVIPQPLGVVGVIVPWNFPIQLSFGPLIDILAAGNRAMVKMSENSVQLSRLLVEISPRYLPPKSSPSSNVAGGAQHSRRCPSTTSCLPARVRRGVPSWPRPPPTCAR